jgi:glycosyltransferase involved in cell wall biosynthesis
MGNKIKILYGPEIFILQKYGGISRYFYELLSKFYEDMEIEFILPLAFSDNYYLKHAPFLICHNFLKPIKTKDKNQFLKFMGKPLRKITKKILRYQQDKNEIMLKEALKAQDFDICHFTYYNTKVLEYLVNKPIVITVYDMIHELFPEFFPNDPTPTYKEQLIKTARKIIAISNNTKQDLMKIYNIHEDKIEVIYLGCSFNNRDLTEKKHIKLPKDYILYVGERKNYKNFKFLIESIVPVFKNRTGLKVICAGSQPFNDSEKDFLQILDLSKKVVHYPVSDEFLIELYKNAIAFVFPSLYEGFGVPVLEAFSAGCPVICSNTSSFPEIAGDAAFFFDPYDKDSIRDSVKNVISDNNLRNELIHKGYERIKAFSWQETANRTKKLYMSLILNQR